MSATACIGLNTPRWTLLVADSGRDLWRLGEGDTRRELVNGEVRELAPVGGVHGRGPAGSTAGWPNMWTPAAAPAARPAGPIGRTGWRQGPRPAAAAATPAACGNVQ